MSLTRDWNGEPLEAINTADDENGTWLVCDYGRNLITTGVVPWPPPSIVQKLHRSRHGDRFRDEIKAQAAEKLGFYCDLQSLHSEDAITWSFFGPLAAAGPEGAARFLNWLCARLDLPWTENRRCAVDLWRRIVHPETKGMGGPELDFVLSGDRSVVLGEAKWFSGEGRGQGRRGEGRQMDYRRRFLSEFAPAIYGDRGRLLLGLVLDQPIEEERPAPVPGVETAALHWADLCEYEDHPAGPEFAAYYDWKQDHMSAAFRRRGRGRARNTSQAAGPRAGARPSE